jgi:hypothetical protein
MFSNFSVNIVGFPVYQANIMLEGFEVTLQSPVSVPISQ